jgi:hypothetical protein
MARKPFEVCATKRVGRKVSYTLQLIWHVQYDFKTLPHVHPSRINNKTSSYDTDCKLRFRFDLISINVRLTSVRVDNIL